MEKLKKLLGEENVKRIGQVCEDLLRQAYRTYAQEGPSGYIEIQSDSPITVAAVTILNSFGFLAEAGYWHAGIFGTFKITKAGQTIFDAHFRKKGEFFSTLEELERLTSLIS
jgi:hypothetical protein